MGQPAPLAAPLVWLTVVTISEFEPPFEYEQTAPFWARYEVVA
jgi:hypothetical protein